MTLQELLKMLDAVLLFLCSIPFGTAVGIIAFLALAAPSLTVAFCGCAFLLFLSPFFLLGTAAAGLLLVHDIWVWCAQTIRKIMPT